MLFVYVLLYINAASSYHSILYFSSIVLKAGFVKQCGNDKICEPDLSIKGELKFGDG